MNPRTVYRGIGRSRGARELVQYSGLVAAGLQGPEQGAITRTRGKEVMWQESEPRASIS